jgi:hypothetical protein
MPVTEPSNVWVSEPYATGEVTRSSDTDGVLDVGVVTVSVCDFDVADAYV